MGYKIIRYKSKYDKIIFVGILNYNTLSISYKPSKN
jgi:hypothetical protein